MKFRLKTSRIAPNLDKKTRELARVPESAYNYFRKITPIDTGNAKRKTRLQGETIKANYPYAQRLDNGWSDQAPQGMSDPTIEYIRDEVRDILGK